MPYRDVIIGVVVGLLLYWIKKLLRLIRRGCSKKRRNN